MTSSSLSISRSPRLRSALTSRSAASRTLRRTSPLAPSASSAARSSSSLFWRASASLSVLLRDPVALDLDLRLEGRQVAVAGLGVDAS